MPNPVREQVEIPTLEQAERWAAQIIETRITKGESGDGEEPLPDIKTLKRIAEAVGARRSAAQQQIQDDTDMLKQLIPLLFLKGMTNISGLNRLTGLHRYYVNDYLDAAGIPRPTSTTRMQEVEKQLAKRANAVVSAEHDG